MLFHTRTEVAAYVARKYDVTVPVALAVVNEAYNYEDDGDTRDLIWEMDDEGPISIPNLTEEDVAMQIPQFLEETTVWEGGIYVMDNLYTTAGELVV